MQTLTKKKKENKIIMKKPDPQKVAAELISYLFHKIYKTERTARRK